VIEFHQHDVTFQLDSEQTLKLWLQDIAKRHYKSIKSLSFIFCSDDFLLDINRQYLQHDYYTDIITFPYSYDPIESEIYISIDRVKDHAMTHSVPVANELLRVMAHGLLHMCGFSDSTSSEKEQMRLQEDISLQDWHALNNKSSKI
jgi:probable rRNA maturation factor